jgi:hypothetical protein
MGGPGSGRRWRLGSNSTTDDYRAMDVRYLARNRMLEPGYWRDLYWKRNGKSVASVRLRAGPGRVVLIYRHRSAGENWTDEQCSIRIERTPCSIGGSRPWFICPAAGCGKRVAILYGGGVFACRHCYRLAYASAREPAFERAARRADRLRERLGWEPGVLNGEGGKPKWMRWRTFGRLTDQYGEFYSRFLAGVAQALGIEGGE